MLLQKITNCVRCFATTTAKLTMEARVLAVFSAKNAEKLDESQLSAAAANLNKETNGNLLKQLQCGKALEKGDCRLLYGIHENLPLAAAVGVGERGAGLDENEGWHEGRENVRKAVAAGVSALKSTATKIYVDPCGQPDAAAEGAVLATFAYDELKKNKKKRQKNVQFEVIDLEGNTSASEAFKTGITMAEGQNLARRLVELPANILTPIKFAEIAQDLFKDAKNTTVRVRDKSWCKEQKMFSMLSVAAGSAQPPIFLEISMGDVKDKDVRPVALVGKGVCFDSGGISLKPSANMDKMRGDMGGAACVLAALHTIQRLNRIPKGGVVALIPLVENMPGGAATRPGDIVIARNGMSIKIDNTDAEGRLILADALSYAETFNPRITVDLATLTGSVHHALGTVASAVYSKSNKLWNDLQKASLTTGERVWRMPLYAAYTESLQTDTADLCNISKPTTGAGSCTAASFLQEFIPSNTEWAHIDIAGVSGVFGDNETGYLKGMTGRPTRTLVEWMSKMESGGISLKPSANMDKMRGDMGGAACVLAALHTIQRLNRIPKGGVVALIPLVENMPGGAATRPGDIVIARNGMSIKIDNTDAEGRLILADALSYAETFNPRITVDLATLTGSVHHALGTVASAVYSKSNKLWNDLQKASLTTGERVWRMPLYAAYTESLQTDTADLCNISKPTTGAGSCTAASFLQEFIPSNTEWAHIDIAGVSGVFGDNETGYLKGMTGRPTRTLVEWMSKMER